LKLKLPEEPFKPTIGSLVISAFAFLSIFILFAGHGHVADEFVLMRKSLTDSLGAKLASGEITPEYYISVFRQTDWATQCGIVAGKGAILGIVGGIIVFPAISWLTTYGARVQEYPLSGKRRHVIGLSSSSCFAAVFLAIASLVDPHLLQDTFVMPLALIYTGVLYVASSTYVILHRARPKFKDRSIELEYIRLYHSQEKEAVNLGLVALVTLFAFLATLIYYGWQRIPSEITSLETFSSVILIWIAWSILPAIGFLVGVVSPRFWVMDELVDRVAAMGT
jgi:hypothetical protein